MPDEDLAREVQELKKALEALKASFEIVSQMAQAYLRLLKVYAEYGGLSIDVVVPEIKNDPIAREIVKILFDLRKANVSQITREMKGRRGKASRNTVRVKLEELEGLGVVREVPSERGKVYALSREVIKRWLELIGKKDPAQLEKLLEELTEEMKNAKSEEELRLLEKKVDIVEDLIEAYYGDRDIEQAAKLMDKIGPMIEDILEPLRDLLSELYSPEKMQAMGKSVAEFYKNLVEAGMDKETATELTKEYMKSINAPKALLETLMELMKGKGGHSGSISIVHRKKEKPEEEEGKE